MTTSTTTTVKAKRTKKSTINIPGRTKPVTTTNALMAEARKNKYRVIMPFKICPVCEAEAMTLTKSKDLSKLPWVDVNTLITLQKGGTRILACRCGYREKVENYDTGGAKSQRCPGLPNRKCKAILSKGYPHTHCPVCMAQMNATTPTNMGAAPPTTTVNM